MHTVSLQLLLGIGALVAVLLRRGADVPWWEAVSTTAHQALGAILLATVATLAVLSRQVRPAFDASLPAARVSASA
jgi:hypothetical protein